MCLNIQFYIFSLELKGIASQPASGNIFVVEKFDQMYTMAETLSMALCDSKSDLPTTTV